MKKLALIIFITAILAPAYSQDIQQIWSKGVRELQNNNLLGGIELMNKYMKYYPSSPYALYNRGMAELRLGDISMACQDLNMAKSLGYKDRKKLISYYCDKNYVENILQKEFYPGQALSPANDYRPMYTRRDTLRGSLRFERTCYDVKFYSLNVRVIPSSRSITGNCNIVFDVVDTTHKIQIDLAAKLPVDSIIWKSRKLNYSREYDAVWVKFPEKLQKNNSENITVYYHGVPRVAPKPPWDGGFVWKHSSPFKLWVGVACEQLGASVWWPNKDYLGDRCDSMAINIEVPKKYKAVCNGRLYKVVPVDKKYTRYEWKVDYPINNYNATFYMGDYVEFTDTLYSLGDTLICRYDVLPKNLEKAKTHFKQAKEVVDFYNHTFGPFPFWKDNYRLVEAPYEGMEHQTAIAYGNSYSNDKNAETYVNKGYDYIIVHESAHEWFGNSITAADMADAWIHEGFATYAEYLFLENKFGYVASLKELQHHLFYVFNFWPIVENYGVNENSFASGDIYIKGAAMLNSLRSSIADDSIFFGLIKNFYHTYKNHTIATKDFLEFVNKYTGKDYKPMLSKYLFDKQLPVLEYSYGHKADGIAFKYKWDNVPAGFEMPFAIELSDGTTMRLTATGANQEVLLKNADWFRFFNKYAKLDNVPKFGFTYYNTHCDKYQTANLNSLHF